MTAPITILVVDDHDLLREGVSSCLAAFEDLEVIGESSSGEDGLAAAVLTLVLVTVHLGCLAISKLTEARRTR